MRGIDLDGRAAARPSRSSANPAPARARRCWPRMGLLAANGRVTGSARYRGTEMVGLDQRGLNRIRGAKITMIFQEPMTSLDPLYTIGRQIAEPLDLPPAHAAGRRRARACIELLDLVGIRRPRAAPRLLSARAFRRPAPARHDRHGARQRPRHPDRRRADHRPRRHHPGADPRSARRSPQAGSAWRSCFITHDLGIVRRFADRVYVMRAGEIVESGADGARSSPRRSTPTRRCCSPPSRAGTKPPPPDDAPVLLEARRRRRHVHRVGGGFLGGPPHLIRAVDGVSLRLRRRQTIGIVGESGSGKSTLGRALLRLLDGDGRIRFEGRDIAGLDRARAAAAPPRAADRLPGPLRLAVAAPDRRRDRHRGPAGPRAVADRAPSATARAVAALAEVGLDPATRNRYPHEFSGGQRQRIAIARAIILKPKVVVLDEPTSALDRSVQKQIIDLLRRLQAEHGLSYIFISHDLAVVRAMSDYILVMKDGQRGRGRRRPTHLRRAADGLHADADRGRVRPAGIAATACRPERAPAAIRRAFPAVFWVVAGGCRRRAPHSEIADRLCLPAAPAC